MKILLCDSCKGSGYVLQYGGRCEGNQLEPCTTCNKTGRIISTTVNYTFPFGSNQQKISRAEDKCHEIYRELNKELTP